MYAQNINGTYTYKPKSNSKSKPFVIEITNDSIYLIKSENNEEDNGKIRKKVEFYYLESCCMYKTDSLNKLHAQPIKITKKKIKVYGFKTKKAKLIKAFELIKEDDL